MAADRKDGVLIVPVGPRDLDELVQSRDRNATLKQLYGRAVLPGAGD